MGSSDGFDLKSALKSWEQSNLSKQELTPSDVEELKEHFLSTLEEIKNKGLSEEEAFAATCVRFGSKQYWGNNMQELNNSSFQLKKLVLFLGGVLFFLFCHYLVLDVHRATVITLINFNGNIELSVKISAITIDTVYLLSFLVIIVSIFTRKIPFIEVIERVKPTPKKAVILLVVVFMLFVLERYLYVTGKHAIGRIEFMTPFANKERDFQIIFPFLFSIGFLIMYLKYHKKAEV